MKSEDMADATCQALDLLPPGDSARSDPRLARDPRLAEEALLARETAAEVWLAVSPLRRAPAEALREILAEIAPEEGGERSRTAWIFAAAGWAAAIAALVCLWPRDGRKSPARISAAAPVPSDFRQERPRAIARNVPSAVRDKRSREEILSLKSRLAQIRGKAGGSAPRVIGLRAPGAARVSPEESRRRLQEILAGALRSALEAESGAPDDPASLVIERGWLPGGLAAPADGGEVRHRHFPEHAWRELGLRRNAAGGYFDPASGMIWSPDAQGRGFIGRQATAEDEIAGFRGKDDPEVVDFPPIEQPRTGPEGFVVEDPVERSAEVVIDGLPPPANGSGHVAVITDEAGNRSEIPIVPEAEIADAAEGLTSHPTAIFSGNPFTAIGGVGVMNTGGGTLIINLSGTAGIADFQLVERQLVPNGLPDRVIVGSGP